MIADVAAEDLDGGVNRQSWEYAQLRHCGVALLATARAALLRRIRGNIRVVRRHDGRPNVFTESVFPGLPRRHPIRCLVGLILRLNWVGRRRRLFRSFAEQLALDQLMK
jgi:hypothetical protein